MGQIVKFVELVHDCILSKQQRNEMNRRYCDAIWSGMKALTAPNYILSKPKRNEMNRQYCDGRLSGTCMNALTAQRFISVQSHETTMKWEYGQILRHSSLYMRSVDQAFC